MQRYINHKQYCERNINHLTLISGTELPNHPQRLQQEPSLQLNVLQIFKPRMCLQFYMRCPKHTCDGRGPLLAFRRCENFPNCEVEYVRLPGSRGSYCSDCMGKTGPERKSLYKKKYYKEKYKERRKAKKLGPHEDNTGAFSLASNNERLPHNKHSTGSASIGFFPITQVNLPSTDRDFSLPSRMISEILEGPDVDYDTDEANPDITSYSYNNVTRLNPDHDTDKAAPDITSSPDNKVTGLNPDHDADEATPEMPSYPYNYVTGLYATPPNYPYNCVTGSYATPEMPSRPYTNYVSGSYAISPYNLTPSPFNQTVPKLVYSSSRNMASPQFPVHPPSSPPIPIDPVLFHMDIVDFHNRRDPNLQDAYVWPES